MLRLPRPLPLLPALLIVLLVLIQYPLWLGKGSWLRVWELDRLVTAQRIVNGRQEQRNTALEAEVRDLKQGLLAIEERARYELGMVRPDEIFVQINPPVAPPAAPAGGPSKQSSEPFRTAAIAPGLPITPSGVVPAATAPSSKAPPAR